MSRKHKASGIIKNNGNNEHNGSNGKNGRPIIVAKNDEQKEVLVTMAEKDITFVRGAAGTGKSFLAIGYGLQELLKGNYTQIILSRPVVEAGGEKLGFLPGDMTEKIDPYMAPLFGAMLQLISPGLIRKLVGKHLESPIRILPLAFMRGYTFINTFVVLDEMQNSTPEQMHMALTRFGDGSKMVICGDVKQSDIHQINGLQNAFELLVGIDEIEFCTLSRKAIVRPPLVGKIAERYEETKEKNNGQTKNRS